MKPPKIVLIVAVFYFGTFFLSNVGAKKKSGVIQFLDVGQGDSILISTHNDQKILIDGGPDNEVDQIIFKEHGLGKCKIDVMVLTHPHADHLKGLNRVLNRCEVGTVFFNEVEYESRVYSEWKQLLRKMEINTSEAISGDSFLVDNITFHVIWPSAYALNRYADNVNDTSIVLLMDSGDFEVLLTGDAEREVQFEMDVEKMKLIIDGPLDIFKVAHHGSVGSLNKDLISKLNPKYAVIGVGENSYGHPHDEVIEYFEHIGVKVMRTDVEGTIEFAIPNF